jgi:hypothetical protein
MSRKRTLPSQSRYSLVCTCLYFSDVLPSPQKPKGQTRDIGGGRKRHNPPSSHGKPLGCEVNFAISSDNISGFFLAVIVFAKNCFPQLPTCDDDETICAVMDFCFLAKLKRIHVDSTPSALAFTGLADGWMYPMRSMYVTTCHAREFRRLYRFKQTCSLLTFWGRLEQRK